MADILIRGMEMPKENEILVFDVWHGKVYARSTANLGTKSYEVFPSRKGMGTSAKRKEATDNDISHYFIGCFCFYSDFRTRHFSSF